MKIDCHLHLPVFEDLQSLEEKRSKLLNDLRKNKIDYAIIIPDNVKHSCIGDVDECIELFQGDSNIFIMGTLSILKDDNSIYLKLESLLREKKIVAIKIFPGHDHHYPNDIRLENVFNLCIKYDVPFVIHTGGNPKDAKYNDPKYIAQIAKKYKDLKIVICHYFYPKVEYCYEITKNCKNIYFDISALADEEVEKCSGKNKIKEVLEKTIKEDPYRIVFGTDYGMCNIEKHIELVNSLDIGDEYKKNIFYKNALKLYNLNIKSL